VGLTLVAVLVLVGLSGLVLLVGAVLLLEYKGRVSVEIGRARTQARIENLANGAMMYKIEGTGNKFFPAQQYAKSILEDGTPMAGISYKQAGSACLAHCLFSQTDPNNPAKDRFPVGNWAVLDEDLLDPPAAGDPSRGRDTPKAYSLVDRSSHPMAILYYVSRRDAAGRIEQYVPDDNRIYTDNHVATNTANGASQLMDIRQYVRGKGTEIRMDGRFVITAAGKGQYFSTTSPKNWPD
jgi:hypothetical protein